MITTLDINTVSIGGRVMREPVRKRTPAGKLYLKLSIAHTRIVSRGTVRNTRTTIVPVGLVPNGAGDAIRKGDCVVVTGTLQRQQTADGPAKRGELYIHARKITHAATDITYEPTGDQ